MEQIPAAVVHRVLVPFLRPCRAFQKVCTGRDIHWTAPSVSVTSEIPVRYSSPIGNPRISGWTPCPNKFRWLLENIARWRTECPEGAVLRVVVVSHGGGVLPRHRVPDLPLPVVVQRLCTGLCERRWTICRHRPVPRWSGCGLAPGGHSGGVRDPVGTSVAGHS